MSMSFQMYEENDGFLFNLDPRIKVLGLLVAFTISVVFSSPYMLGPLFFFILFLVIISKVPLRKVGLLLWSLVALAVMSILMWPLFFKNGNVLFTIFNFNITDQGILFGIAMAFRIMSMVMATIALMVSTSQKDLILGLRGLGLPYNGAFVFATAFRFLPMMTGIGQTINEAQRARGVDFNKGIFIRMKNNASILAPMIIESIRLSQQLMYSVEARGFSRKNKKTTINRLEFNIVDKVALVFLLLVLTTSIILRLKGFGYIAR